MHSSQHFPSILIVDDIASDAHELRHALEGLGYKNIRIVNSSGEAMQEISMQRPDIIITEAILQGNPTGVTLAEAAQKEFETPVVYLTGHLDKQGVLETLKRSHPKEIFKKPYDLKKLQMTINLIDQQNKFSQDNLSFFEDTPMGAFIMNMDKPISLDLQTEELLRYAFHNLRITKINEAFKKIFRKSLLHEMFASLFEKNTEEGETFLKNLLQEQKLQCQTKLYIEGKREVILEGNYHLLFDNNKEVIGFLGLVTDITEKYKIEQELIRINQELDSFAHRSSHDLRAPMRSILGLVGIIKETPEPEQQQEYLELIEKSIFKLDNFISDMTNFSKNTRLKVEVSQINFEQIIKETLEGLQFMENADKISISYELLLDAPFFSDYKRLEILFQNMVSNAIKYQNAYAEQAYLKIKIWQKEKNLFIQFADNGMGIAPSHLNKIFEMFYRATQQVNGSGLGLYIVAQIIEKLQGNIEVKSQLGKGTTFTIQLPDLKEYTKEG